MLPRYETLLHFYYCGRSADDLTLIGTRWMLLINLVPIKTSPSSAFWLRIQNFYIKAV